MIFGFTGTREGMTKHQRRTLSRILAAAPSDAGLRHGDCVGADDEAHEIAHLLGLTTFVHPPNVDKYRAWNQGNVCYAPKDYLARDRDIVNRCDHLLAAPLHGEPQERGGTWYTVRYALDVCRPGRIIWPDGTTNTIDDALA